MTYAYARFRDNQPAQGFFRVLRDEAARVYLERVNRTGRSRGVVGWVDRAALATCTPYRMDAETGRLERDAPIPSGAVARESHCLRHLMRRAARDEHLYLTYWKRASRPGCACPAGWPRCPAPDPEIERRASAAVEEACAAVPRDEPYDVDRCPHCGERLRG